MIKKSVFIMILFSLVGLSALSGIANAYWIWTPETKKFTNPKYAVKDSPKEQFDWAMSFYNAKDFQRSATEFEKLAKQYEFSEYASKAQYYVGLCYENMNKYYMAYQNYQKAIDNFPHISNTEEILAREFSIGNLYLSKPGPKVLGTDIMAPLDRAVEIFKKVVENAPYGKFAEESQFRLGEALKKSERYEEAVQAFHKIVEDYPKSTFATQSMYEESNCAYKASLRPAYDAAATDNAIKTFEKFVDKNKGTDLARDAGNTMKRLKDNVAEKSFRAAQFYEAQGKTQAAIIYYQDVIDTYPDSTFVKMAKDRIEALKAGPSKKAAAPIDLSKKKPEQVNQKKPWKALKFENKKEEKKTEAPAQPVPAKEASEKKAWKPFKFESEKPQKKPEAIAPAASEAPKKKAWNPFSFESEKKKTEAPAQPVPAKEASEKKAWKPFKFESEKPQKKPEAVVPEATKKNTWKPLSFKSNKKKAEVVAQITPAAQIKKEESSVPAVETPAAQPAPQTVEATKAEPSAQPAGNITAGTSPAPEVKVEETPSNAASSVSEVKEVPRSESSIANTQTVETQVIEAPNKEEAASQVPQDETPKKKDGNHCV